jgi:hypothetical protein
MTNNETSETRLQSPASSFEKVYYFGYGAMVNPTTRARRGVETTFTSAATLADHKLTFDAAGSGSILSIEGETVHGVVMELASQEAWDIVQKQEHGYSTKQSSVQPYGGGEPILAHMFWIDPEHFTDSLPQERYLKVIAAGMRHHGVEEDYIVKSVLGAPHIPSRKPDNYMVFSSEDASQATVAPTISMEEYKERCLTKPHFIVGRRVVQIVAQDGKAPSPFFNWTQSFLCGQEDATWKLWNHLVEPDLPPCDSPEQLTELHQRWAEDQLRFYFDNDGLHGKVVALIP